MWRALIYGKIIWAYVAEKENINLHDSDLSTSPALVLCTEPLGLVLKYSVFSG